MKHAIVLIAGLLFGVKTYAQQPVFLSPYKSGKPVPENQKDYSTPSPVNMLANGAKKTTPAPVQTQAREAMPANSTNAKPVMLNTKKEPKN